METTPHQHLLEFFVGFRRPNRQASFFNKRAPAGFHAFISVQAAVAGIDHGSGPVVNIQQNGVELTFGA
ncbi:MAG: hypothetical protein KKF30_13435 [Proteobacteria bacterium]|nr:hypothetical protein [Pseudomonadota bacterium]